MSCWGLFKNTLVSGVRSGELDKYLESYDRGKLEKGSDKNYAKRKREEMQDTAWGQSTQVLSKLDKASLETFGPMEENIKGVAQGIQGLIGSYTDFVSNKENKELVQNVIKTTGALVGLNLGLKAGKLAFALIKNPIVSVYEGYTTLRSGLELLSKSQRISTAWTMVSSKASAGWTFVTGIASKAASLLRLQNLKNIAVMGISKATSLASSTATGIATAAQWAWNVALNANPIGLVVTGVAALTAGGIWLYKNWKKLPELFSNTWESVKGLFSLWKDEDDLKKTATIETKADENLDNVIDVDFTTKLKKLESQQYENIPLSSSTNETTNEVVRSYSDNRKIVIQNLTVHTNAQTNNKDFDKDIKKALAEVIDHNWGNALYDQGGVINGIG